ncbi:class I SAM-dependent methyltransferase [Planktomarina temperata]|nr:class I SAM-dependent methyltransferase [Planktomarina temperata]
MKKFIKAIANRFGIEIVKLEKSTGSENLYCQYSKVKSNIIDVEALGKISLTVPGMITPEAGKFLYSLCYMQDLEGDVVEIGSWQGRSSIFLARAVKESGNGNFYAIDHFGGNVGKEKFYKVNGSLASLKDNFIDNLSRLDLTDTVNLLDMTNTEASEKIKDRKIRFLFIDGDHTKSGVRKDIELFFPQLEKGSIVVFDDYFEGFPGLIEAVDEILENIKVDKIFYHRHTLVIKI